MLLHNIILKREDRMLQLKNIVKDYHTGDEVVQALKGVSVNFRRNEFVSILGQSGCGKTTLLNIVGGLDQYTSGDLVINGKSTKDFKSRDWDSYRNNSVGFVFQSYSFRSLCQEYQRQREERERRRFWRRSVWKIRFTRNQTRCPVDRCRELPSPEHS